MSKRLAEEMTAAWTARTGIATIVLRPVMVLADDGFRRFDPTTADLGACVHVDDVADAVVAAVTVPYAGHARMILCGPGDFDPAVARRVLGWPRGHSPPTFPERGR